MRHKLTNISYLFNFRLPDCSIGYQKLQNSSEVLVSLNGVNAETKPKC